MRNQLKWYCDREEEILLAGVYKGLDNTYLPLFTHIVNLKTEEEINHIHIKLKDMEIQQKLKEDVTYTIRGYVKTYKRRNGEIDYCVTEVIIERV